MVLVLTEGVFVVLPPFYVTRRSLAELAVNMIGEAGEKERQQSGCSRVRARH